ncbi:MAG: UPF0147 family protein [Nanoarchaeota archaeon]|nr:UPF0147 family protein [Nanoarchaeota archaeon]
MMTKDIQNVIELLSELSEDTSIPKNVREKTDKIRIVLEEDVDVSIKVNKALNELDEIGNDNNIEPYTRTQIWNIVSLLEKI